MLLTVALAGPTADTREPRNRATVMLAIDVSLSMEATDVAPNRLAAAQEAATKSFVDDLTPGVNLGIVSFAGIATVLVSPTTDRDGGQAGHRRADAWTSGPPPARRSSRPADHRPVLPVDLGRPEDGPPPARIVLMTDGKRTVPAAPRQDAAHRGPRRPRRRCRCR